MAARKTILIVGASRGLGLALAGEFCARDWHVIATSRGRSAAPIWGFRAALKDFEA
jgi:NAD(P)-dependent dehydrogenase (short-subunit alcohol dehydrogenase family)